MLQHTFSIKRNEMLQTNIKLGLDLEYPVNKLFTLLDTGAGFCHMSYALWRLLSFDEILQKDIDQKYSNRFRDKIKDLAFDDLPLHETRSKLGNNSEVKVYIFKLDYLSFGDIKFEDVHVRLINSGNEPVFIVGWNILKYLTVNYSADLAGDNINCKLTLRPFQKHLYEKDKREIYTNYTASRFNYIPELIGQ